MTTIATGADGTPTGLDLDRPVSLHPLRYLDEGDEVTVGRPDIESYCVLPADGAALLRTLGEGAPPRAAAEWYATTYGETVDIEEFLAAMDELGFTATSEAPVADSGPVRWQRLGAAVFSPVAWVLYALVIGAAVFAALRDHTVLPHYRNLFFTPYMTLLELVIFLGQFPLLLWHESFHALAGRRIGIRSTLGVGQRLYWVVFETTLDGLVAVPRAKRYLPMLAGMLADLLAAAVLTLVAAVLAHPDGTLPLTGGICLALSFTTLLRFVWQFYFYLQTDLYHVAVTVLGCVNLQVIARRKIANRVNGLLGRTARLHDESTWHPRDRAVARWYSWLLVVGYAFSIGTLLVAGLPAMITVLGKVFGRLFTDGPATAAGLTDSIVFLALNLAQILLLTAVTVRERRRHRNGATHQHLID